MKFILFILISISLSGFSQSNSDFEMQLKLKYSDNYISHIKSNNIDLYQFYISELKSSFEFVDLNSNLKYNELIAYDFINKQEKNAPEFTEATFSLYNYKFTRYKDKDVVYRIPGTNQGVLIYSKEKFTSKL